MAGLSTSGLTGVSVGDGVGDPATRSALGSPGTGAGQRGWRAERLSLPCGKQALSDKSELLADSPVKKEIGLVGQLTVMLVWRTVCDYQRPM